MRKDLADARAELRKIYDKEITKWCRIRLKAVDRGFFELASEIYEDVQRARRDMDYDEYFFQYRYKYLFTI